METKIVLKRFLRVECEAKKNKDVNLTLPIMLKRHNFELNGNNCKMKPQKKGLP